MTLSADLRASVGLSARRTWVRPDGPGKLPPCPQGWRIGPPDFVGVGAQKAGTSWWHQLVADHPQVARARGRYKELHYFDHAHAAPLSDEAITRYQFYFPRPVGSIAGEWTPRYLPDLWTHAELRRAAPDAKLLVMLRDPVERYLSGLTHEHSRGGRRGPNVALEATFRGLYHVQLTSLLAHFPRRQVLVLQYEKCRQEPLVELARTYEFLGLDDVTFVPGSLDQQVNPTRAERQAVSQAMREALVTSYAPDVARLAGAFPEIDVELWPNFAGISAARPQWQVSA